MEILGLLLTLCGLGGIFFVWLQLMGNKAKTVCVDADEAPAEQDSMFTPALRLVPAAVSPDEPTTMESLPETPAERVEAFEACSDTAGAPEPPSTAEEKHLKTQLEIAIQLFDTGDFEGAFEMAEIVCESRHATEAQKAKASGIMSLSNSL